jgi:hypothetical protein
MSNLLSTEVITSKIYIIRGKKIMLDRDLAFLYRTETRILNQAVKRNIHRFPDDFMFQLSEEETKNWISQIVTSNKEKMGLRKRPLAFTEHGILMLSSVLNSRKAVYVNIQIMRTFIQLRRMLLTNHDLRRKIAEMEKKYDHQFKIVFDAIRQLLTPPEKPKRRIGFHPHED